MNKHEFFLPYQQEQQKRQATNETAYCRRQCQARRRIETLRDWQALGLSPSDMHLLES